MPDATTVVIGAGHCGLAMSRASPSVIDHVVPTRRGGELVAHQRWDSLRLLTPNWMTRLPGFAYRGDDPDGYICAPHVAPFIEDYAAESAAPVRTDTRVSSVRPAADRFVVGTDRGTWRAPTVVVAAGGATVASSARGPRGDTFPPGSRRWPPGLPRARPASGRLACWWSGGPPAGSRSPRRCRGPGGR